MMRKRAHRHQGVGRKAPPMSTCGAPLVPQAPGPPAPTIALWLPALVVAAALVVGVIVGAVVSNATQASSVAARASLPAPPLPPPSCVGPPARAEAAGGADAPGPMSCFTGPPAAAPGQEWHQQHQHLGAQLGGDSARPVPPPGGVDGRHEWPIAHGEIYDKVWKGWLSSHWNATEYGPTVRAELRRGPGSVAHTLRWEDVRPGLGYCNWTRWRSPVFYPKDYERLHGWPENTMVADGALFVDKRGELFFEPVDCNLYRHTAAQARSCLANKTIAIIGDSISRYQYLSLGHFLVHGKYEQRYGDDVGRPTLAGHQIGAWGGWPQFLEGSSARLHVEGPELNSTTSCDCVRGDVLGPETRENRELNITLEGTTIRLIYRQVFRWPSTAAKSMQELMHVVSGAGPPPDVIIMNAFAWLPSHPVLRDEFDWLLKDYLPLFQLGRKLMSQHPGLVMVWRMPTVAVSPIRWREQMRSASMLEMLARWHGWRIHSADAVTLPAMRQDLNVWAPDGLHPLPFVYEEINSVLLNLVCPLPEA